MNILICAAAYPPMVGGVQTLSARLAGELARRGKNQVRVLARGRADDPALDNDVAPARVRRVGWKPLLWPVFGGEIFRDRPEVVMLTHRADFLRPAMAARRMGVPCAVIVHGNEVYASSRSDELIAALTRADAVIAVSRYALGRLQEMGLRARRMAAIPSGVSFDNYGPPEDGDIVRRELGLEGKKVILSVGRLNAVKGFDTVVRALPRIVRKVPDVVYCVVGGGPEAISLWALAKELDVADRVIFTGEVPLSELGRGKHAYYQACDVFAMPSRNNPDIGQVEALGIAHLEAGVCGKPVVGGRSGGTFEAVADGESGLLVEPERPEEVADAIVRIISSPDLAKEMGEKGRRRAEERTWRKVAGEYEAILREVAGG